MNKHCDLIVLGAGPAGCAAAIRARQAGLDVCMFDLSAAPKVSPGETLHPGIESILSQLGVLEEILRTGFHRHLGVWIEHGGNRHFLPYGEDEDGPWRGFQVDRRIFQQILQRAAINAGAMLIRGKSPDNVLVAGNRVTGVTIDGCQFRAHWTVDGTGRSAWLARMLGLQANVCSPPLGARFGWRNGKPPDLDDQPSFVFREDGWNWRAPLGDDRTAWVDLRIGDPAGAIPAGVDLTWQFRPACAGPGFFLIGDAAATLDPSSSHGVLRALMSGIMCGHLVAGHRYMGVAEKRIVESYRAWLCTQFEYEEMRLRLHYAASPAGRHFIVRPWAEHIVNPLSILLHR